MGKRIQRRTRDKGGGVREQFRQHFADIGKTLRRNVVEGLQSAAGGGDSRFGRPPALSRRRLGQTSRSPRSR